MNSNDNNLLPPTESEEEYTCNIDVTALDCIVTNSIIICKDKKKLESLLKLCNLVDFFYALQSME